MSELNALAPARKGHRMIAHHIAAANRVNANLRGRTAPAQTLATVCNVLRVIKLPDLAQNFRQSSCGAARRILFHAMMHLDNFKIETGTEHLCRFPGQPEERIHADAEIRRGNNRQRFCCSSSNVTLLIGMARGAGHQRLPGAKARPANRIGRGSGD